MLIASIFKGMWNEPKKRAVVIAGRMITERFKKNNCSKQDEKCS